MAYSGYSANRENSACGVSPSSTTGVVSTPGSRSSMSMAARPKMENHTRSNAVGKSSVPPMNSRTVRPREMRAKNMPTKGDQQMVQAQ